MFSIEVKTNLVDYATVVRDAVVETSRTIRDRSRKDVAGSMHNAGRWAKGLETNFKAEPGGGGYRIGVYLKPGFLHGFEYGMTSVGKPKLWIPIAPNRMKARKFKGTLFRLPGRNVLGVRGSRVHVRGMAGTGSGKFKALFVGVSSVTNRQRFHLRAIAGEEAEHFVTRLRAARAKAA
jgi:hypothetical protein